MLQTIKLYDVTILSYMRLLILTLRGLSLFFKFLPISNTGNSIAYILATVHFLYPKIGSFSDMECYFYHLAYRDWKVPKCFVALNQMSNAVLSLFWLELWQTKWPHCMLVPATPMISDFTAREMPQVPTRACGQGH